MMGGGGQLFFNDENEIRILHCTFGQMMDG